jgi:ethanolamine ammonia-lyase small subunit
MKIVVANPWGELRRHTPARIALGRAGISLPSAPQLAFQLAHAQARDAVHRDFDVSATTAAIEAVGLQTMLVQSAATDRLTYLQRPDLGRRLDDASAASLAATFTTMRGDSRFDLALVVADGLSALAAERHAAPFIAGLLALLNPNADKWRIAPVVLARQARVALGDEIGSLLGADLVLVLIGERPGLSSPDSMGLYLTWAPRVGRTDAERNCISNVRPEGLQYDEAAHRAAWLMREARNRQQTGIALKDESGALAAVATEGPDRIGTVVP